MFVGSGKPSAAVSQMLGGDACISNTVIQPRFDEGDGIIRGLPNGIGMGTRPFPTDINARQNFILVEMRLND
jgi:hypothetical protein